MAGMPVGASGVRVELALEKAPGEQVHERDAVGQGAKRRGALSLAGAAVLALGLAGCSTYHPLPLPQGPNLVHDVSQLNLTVPPVEEGKPATKIDPAQPLSPDQVGLLAILNDPDLVASRAQLGVAKADEQAAGILPNPSVGLGYAFLLGGPGTVNAFSASISQDIKSILTYHSTVKAAKSRYDQVNADLLWEEWQVAQKARLLAVDIYSGSKEVQLRTDALATMSDQLNQVIKATEAGNLDFSTEAPLRASVAGAERDLVTAKLGLMKNWQDLDALLGLKPDARFAIAQPEPVQLPDDLEPLITSLPSRRPDLIALRLGYDAADEDVRTAILGQFPAFSLGGAGGSDTSSVSSFGPQITFDLPIFDRGQAGVASARATRVQLHAEYQSRLDDADGTARSLIVQNREIAANLDRAIKAADIAAQHSQAAQKAYAQGNLNQRDLSDYESTALDRAVDVLDYQQSLREGELALAIELGLGLPTVTLTPTSTPQLSDQVTPQ